MLTAAGESDDLPLFARPADAADVEPPPAARSRARSAPGPSWSCSTGTTRAGRNLATSRTDLIALLDESKFGGHEYTPYEIYLKTLYEYFRDELGGDGLPLPGTRSAVELTRFQEDAVQKARRILARYDGVLIADSVGLGKTWIGKKLLEDTAYHRRQKALVICPAALREMWRAELREAAIPAEIVSQELLGRADCEIRPYRDVDVILIDESHNFRNHNTNRYENLERLIGANGGLGRDGERKQVILLTATPINNTIFDLYNQLMLFAQGDRTYFSAAGIGDLRRYFLEARRAVLVRRRSPQAAARPRRFSTCWRRSSSAARGPLSARPTRKPPSTGSQSTGPSGSCTPCATTWRPPTPVSTAPSSPPSRT